MTEFPVDVLWAIKSMFIRSIWNPNAFKYTINNLLDVYRYVIFIVFLWVIGRFLLRFEYKILKKIKEYKKDKNSFIKFLYKVLIDDIKKDKNSFKKFLNKELSFKKYWKNEKKFIKIKKEDIKEIFSEEKHIFNLLKYPIIWSILVWTRWTQVSLLLRLFGKYYGAQWDIIRETLPLQEGWVLWVWAIYSLLIFIIAWYFIWLSFWNKMLRNIWILIYALWILFILFGHFLDNWVIINNLPNFTV